MGGVPLTALNIVAWPRDGPPMDLLGRVLDGAAEVLERAGCALVGGTRSTTRSRSSSPVRHRLVDPAALLTNAAGRPGDALVLTKPLGTGVVTAAKRGECPPDVPPPRCGP